MRLESYLLSVIKGERRRFPDRLVLLGLSFLELIYALLSALRSVLYRCGWLPCRRLSVPVISIGNLAAGGTGKTPLALFLAQRLTAMGHRPGVLLRGYRGKGEGARLVTPALAVEDTGDEAQLLARSLPGVPIAVGADRLLSGALAIGNGADRLILDDAFQRRGIHRDMDILLLHGASPWENGHLIPRGLLREGKNALRRADLIVITNMEAVADSDFRELVTEIRRFNSTIPIVKMFTHPAALYKLEDWWRGRGGADAKTLLQNKPVEAFTAIGRPEKFFDTLKTLGAEVGKTWTRPDHAEWGDAEFLAAPDKADDGESRFLLTTEKDAVKLKAFLGLPVAERIWVLSVQAIFSSEDLETIDKMLGELGR